MALAVSLAGCGGLVLPSHDVTVDGEPERSAMDASAGKDDPSGDDGGVTYDGGAWGASSGRDARSGEGVMYEPDARAPGEPDVAGEPDPRPAPDAAGRDPDAGSRDAKVRGPGADAGESGEAGGGGGGPCPSDAPSHQSTCGTPGLLCLYATEDCTCDETWMCFPCPAAPPSAMTSCTATGATCHYPDVNVGCTCNPDGWVCDQS